jgi:exodeoxyribonuclease V gamma subunit
VLRVYYSNRTEELLQAFVENVRTHRGRPQATQFEPTHLVVPNRNIETYVKLGVARLTGIAANIQVSFLEAFIDELAAQATGESQVTGRVLLQDLLLQALLDDKLLSHPELEPVRQYLKAAGYNPDAVDLRRFQLSRQLTKLFDEYAVSRPDLLASWKDGPVIHDDERKAAEVWQRRLWLSIYDADTPKTPFEAINKIDPQNLQLPDQVHFFGISYMARAFLDTLGCLAKASDLNIYMLNPCSEVWERGGPAPKEANTSRYERRAAELGPTEIFILKDPFRLENPGENPALRQWGRPGRENLRLLNALTGCELIPRHKDQDKDETPGNRTKTTLLRQIQRDILHRQPEPKAIPTATSQKDDESLVFLSCPGVRRELEVVAAEIWSLLKKDEARAENQEPLRFNDIALILPPRNTEPYQSLVGTVFGEMYDIPHNLVDLPIGGESRLGEAIEFLLALPLGRFTRQEVLRFATHPVVASRFPEASPDDWLGWCDSLGIVHGADRRDHRDTYIERDLLNWDQGLKRLALGAFMTGERSEDADERIFSLGEDLYLPEEVSSDQTRSAASFGLLIRSLIHDARFATKSRMRFPEWIQFITTLITTYVTPRSEEDERVLRRCLRRITALADMTLGERKVPYRIPYELVLSEMAGLQGALGQYLVDGVVVSTFLPMRAIPFKVIFIVGLGEKQFPAADPESRLDLRLANRRAGDVRPREQDKYMFLETLLSAREKLYLSYVSRDELTGGRLEPSSVLLELRQMLERGYVPREALEKEIDQNRYPLRRFDDPKTIEASPAAANEKRLRSLGQNLRDKLGPTKRPDLTELQKNLSNPVWTKLRNDLGLCPAPPESPPASQEETIRVPLSAIRKFLECPLQGSASFLLRMSEEEDEDVLSREDEAFGTEPLHRATLLREVFLRAVATEKTAPTPQTLTSGYEKSVLRYELKGLTPTGLFQKTERENHLEVLVRWAEQFRDLTGDTQPKLGTLRVGPSWEHAKADEVLDPIVLTIKTPHPTRVEISGTTQPLLDEPRGFLRLLTRRCLNPKPHKEFLRVFLDQVLLAAANRGVHSAHSAFIINAHPQAKAVLRECVFRAIKPKEARSYLTTLVETMLSRVHDYLLPCDAVFELEVSGEGELDKTKLASVLEKTSAKIESTASRWGPVAHPEDYQPPDPDQAAEMIRKRFWLYFVKRVVPEADS